MSADAAAQATAPRVLSPLVVVDAPGLRIEEHVGHSTGEAALSLAKVTVTAPHVDPAHTPLFDEYILVLSGEVHVAVGGKAAPLVARAGQTLHLPKGFAYTVTTPGPAEYIPVCYPAFHPSLKG